MINPLCAIFPSSQYWDKNSIVIEKVELIIIRDYHAFMNKESHCHHTSAIYKNKTEFDNEITIYHSIVVSWHEINVSEAIVFENRMGFAH